MTNNEHTVLSLNTDGGSRNNPGNAAIGFVIKDSGTVIYEGKQYIGIATNNEAEYKALLEGIKLVKQNYPKCSELNIFCDSELVVKQIKGEYKIKLEHLKSFALSIKSELSTIKRWTLTHVKRESNSEADKLVNEALDEQAKV